MVLVFANRLVPICALVVSACCGGDRNTTRSTSFVGVTGQILEGRDACGDGCDTRGSPGVVRILSRDGASVVASSATHADGKFAVPVAPGEFHVELAPFVGPVDRSIGSVTVTARGGIEIIRTYVSVADSHALRLDFHASVSETRQATILEQVGLARLPGSFPPGIAFVRIPEGIHPQLIGEDLLARFPDEITGFELNRYSCAD